MTYTNTSNGGGHTATFYLPVGTNFGVVIVLAGFPLGSERTWIRGTARIAAVDWYVLSVMFSIVLTLYTGIEYYGRNPGERRAEGLY